MTTLLRKFPLLLLMGVSAVPAAEPPPGATITHYLMKMQSAVPAPAVEYCAQASPSTRAELDKEFTAFNSRVAQATEPLLQRIGKDLKPLAAAEAANLERVIQEGGEKQLAAVKQEDPASYCPWLMNKLRSSTVEALRTRIESAYDRYLAASRGQTG